MDVTIDRKLRIEGLARELARMVNDLRRCNGFQRGERVGLVVAVEEDPAGELGAMLERWPGRIAGDVGAETFTVGDAAGGESFGVGGGLVRVRLDPATRSAPS